MQEDKISQVTAQTDKTAVTVKTQVIDEPRVLVILVTEKTLDKTTGKSETKIIHRKELIK